VKNIVKAAVAQLAPEFLDRTSTIEKACRAVLEASKAGAHVIAFPEVFVPGYPHWTIVRDPTDTGSFMRRLHENAVEIPSESTEILCAAAKDAGIFVCIGVNEKDRGTLYNTVLFIGPEGRVLGKHRKLVPTNHERMVWGRGDGRDLRVFESEIGVMGGLICYEHANALFGYALQAQYEQIHLAVWPGGMPSITGVIDAAMRHYAFSGGCFVLCATSILTPGIIDALGEGGSVSKLSPGGGCSMIVGPRGAILAGPAAPEDETILYADLDPAQITEAKSVLDCAGHYARPDVLKLQLYRDRHSSLEISEVRGD
jgi:aliphatic nitrilase